MSKVIAVFDASGPIGKSLVQALSRDFHVRAISREGSAVGQREQHPENVERVTVSYSSQPSMDAALQGAHACFVITKCDFSDPLSVENEIKDGKLIAAACSRASVQHVVYSTQLSVSTIIGVPARHMDAKMEVERIFRESMIPLTCLIIPCCYEMLLVEPLIPKRVHQDQYALEIPIGQCPLPMMSVVDIGYVVRAVLLQPGQYTDKTLSPCGDKCTVSDMVAMLNKHLAPRKFKDNQITLEAFRRQDFLGADDMANMFDFYCRLDQRASIDLTKKISPSVMSFEHWVTVNKEDIVTALDYADIASPSPDPWR